LLPHLRKAAEPSAVTATATTAAAGLHAITLGAMDATERMYRDALPALEPIILTGKVAGVRVAAIDALGMLCFVGSEGAHETLECMALLTKACARGVRCPELARVHHLLALVPGSSEAPRLRLCRL
jgi:hypothetical protein